MSVSKPTFRQKLTLMEPLRIVIPIDLAGKSETAFEFVQKLAETQKVEAVLIHVLASPVLTGLNYPDMGYIGDMQNKVQDAAEAQMQELEKKDFFRNCTVTSKVISFPAKSIGEEIAAYALGIHADLLLLISRHRKGFDSIFEGTHLMHLVRHSRVPTLVLSPNELPSLRRIAFATDFSDESVRIAKDLKEFADRFKTAVHLFSVASPDEFMSHREFTALRNDFSNKTGPLGFVEASLHNSYSITFGIPEYAEDHACDTIALATHGRQGLSRVFAGSVCEAVIRSSRKPLLIFNLSD